MIHDTVYGRGCLLEVLGFKCMGDGKCMNHDECHNCYINCCNAVNKLYIWLSLNSMQSYFKLLIENFTCNLHWGWPNVESISTGDLVAVPTDVTPLLNYYRIDTLVAKESIFILNVRLAKYWLKFTSECLFNSTNSSFIKWKNYSTEDDVVMYE